MLARRACFVFFLGKLVKCVNKEERQRKKGWKKEGKSAEREAVIEAIQHW